MFQLEECAIQLWNWAVTKNVGATLNDIQKAKGTVLVSIFRFSDDRDIWKYSDKSFEMLTQCRGSYGQAKSYSNCHPDSASCRMYSAVLLWAWESNRGRHSQADPGEHYCRHRLWVLTILRGHGLFISV